MAEDPAAEAVAELRRHQEAAGITFDDPDAPVTVPGDDDLPPWMTHDEEL
jgi:hypothetical protein